MKKKQYIQPLIEIQDIEEQDDLLIGSNEPPTIDTPVPPSETEPEYDGTIWGEGEDDI